MMDQRTREILIILQEEAAEVIQEISKIFRFGLDEPHRDGGTHRQKLTEELGDLLTMIDLLRGTGIVESGHLEQAQRAKIAKLRQFSGVLT